MDVLHQVAATLGHTVEEEVIGQRTLIKLAIPLVKIIRIGKDYRHSSVPGCEKGGPRGPAFPNYYKSVRIRTSWRCS